MGWVDLSTLYVNKSGDTMNGSLTVPANSSLICYNDTTSYNVGATLKSLQDSVSQLKAAQTPGAWTYLYGSDGGECVVVRLVGPIAELRWSFTQETTNTWVLEGLPADMCPATGFVVPAASAYRDGSISNNTAMCEVWNNGTIHFRNMSGITGGLNRGHCLWVVG